MHISGWITGSDDVPFLCDSRASCLRFIWTERAEIYGNVWSNDSSYYGDCWTGTMRYIFGIEQLGNAVLFSQYSSRWIPVRLTLRSLDVSKYERIK